ncbi:hypothetical protein D3C71_1751920 [compost metagenome]
MVTQPALVVRLAGKPRQGRRIAQLRQARARQRAFELQDIRILRQGAEDLDRPAQELPTDLLGAHAFFRELKVAMQALEHRHFRHEREAVVRKQDVTLYFGIVSVQQRHFQL